MADVGRSLKYSDFAQKIDMDRLYEALEYEVISTNRSGDDLGFCPDPWGLHSNGDTQGKFAIHPEKRLYHCWVCGGGTMRDLVMAVRDCDDETATEWLYQFAVETEQDDDSFLVELDEILRVVEREKFVMPVFNEHVLDKWCDTMDLEYAVWLDNRGISESVMDDFRVGAGMITKRAPRKDGVAIDADYTGPAIVFPHYWQGKLVGWQNRWLDDDRPKWCAKYTNTSEFPKNYTIFNFDRAALRPDPPVVLESVPSVLKLESNGVSAVATFGSSVPDDQLRILRRFQQGVILAPDNDGAGSKWLRNLTSYLERYIPVYRLPPVDRGEGADLGDLDGDELMAHLDLWE